MPISAVILSAGSASRMGFDKILAPLCEKPVIVRTAEIFTQIEQVNEIIVVSSENNREILQNMLSKEFPQSDIRVIPGGKTRGESSMRGISAAKNEYVLIHDGARPLVSKGSVIECIEAAYSHGAAALAVTPKDTVKRGESGVITETVPRSEAFLIQTPQIFRTAEIAKAYKNYSSPYDTDDCGVAERAGIKIHIVNGEYTNIKLTTPEDMELASLILRKAAPSHMSRISDSANIPHALCADSCEAKGSRLRIGTGFDSHRLVEGRPLIIGGVTIPHGKGLLGHSDADVLIHAVIDALFGSCAMGNIGQHFPDTDEKYSGISSILLLRKTGQMLKNAGYSISNIDATVIIQQPKMAPFIEQIRSNISSALDIHIRDVSVKAKTNEGMGFTGRGEGVEARAVAAVYGN